MPNGGVLTVNLYRMTPQLIAYCRVNGTNTSGYFDTPTVANWT